MEARDATDPLEADGSPKDSFVPSLHTLILAIFPRMELLRTFIELHFPQVSAFVRWSSLAESANDVIQSLQHHGSTADLGPRLLLVCERDDEIRALFPTIPRREGSPGDGADAWRSTARYLEWLAAFADRVPIRPRSGADVEDYPLEPLFVRLTSRPLDGTNTSSECDLHELLAEYPRGRWTLQGDPGCGKTTVLRELATRRARIAQATLRARTPLTGPWVPLLVNLSALAETLVSPSAWVEAEVRRFRPAAAEGLARTLEAHIEAGRALLLLDGMDEVQVDRRAVVRRYISDWAANAPNMPIVMTSRRFGYLRPAAAFTELELMPMSLSAQHALLARWLPDPEHLAEVEFQIGTSASLRDMASNPFVLTLVALLARTQRAAGEAVLVPTRRTSLYREMVGQFILGCVRTEARRRLTSEPEEVRGFLRRLAWSLLHKNADRWPRAEVEREVDVARGCLAIVDRGRTAQDLLDALVADTGLLVASDPERSMWVFLHRTLLEFLVAETLHAAGEIEIRKLARRLLGPRWWMPWSWSRRDGSGRWAEVFALLAGLQGDVPAAFEFLSRLKRYNYALFERALANVEELPIDDVLGLLGGNDTGDPLIQIREVIERVQDDQARAEMLVSIGSRGGQGLRMFADAALVMLAADDDHRRELARRCGGEPPSGLPIPAWISIDASPRAEVVTHSAYKGWAVRSPGIAGKVLVAPVNNLLWQLVVGYIPGPHLGPVHVTWTEAFLAGLRWTQILRFQTSVELATLQEVALVHSPERPVIALVEIMRAADGEGEWCNVVPLQGTRSDRGAACPQIFVDEAGARWRRYSGRGDTTATFRCSIRETDLKIRVGLRYASLIPPQTTQRLITMLWDFSEELAE